MKILFLNLPYKFAISRSSRWPEKTKSGTMYYPYWLCYAAGVCMDRGYDVELVDCIVKKMSTEDVVELVQKSAPDYIVGEITTSTCFHDYETLAAIKKAYPQGKIIIGGTHATALSERVLEECPDIDVIVRQEYDFTLDEVMKAGADLSDVLGITWRCDGQIVKNPDRPWTEDLDRVAVCI